MVERRLKPPLLNDPVKLQQQLVILQTVLRNRASFQKLPNSEILSYLEIGRHLGVLILQKEVS